MSILVDNSNYSLSTAGGWLQLTVVCGAYLMGKDHQQLCAYLKDDAQTVIVEKSYVDKDYRDTFSHF